MIEAVLFDWGGTLSPLHEVDLLLAWESAAHIIAPDRAAEAAEALLSAERTHWQETTASMTSFTTEQVVRGACRAIGVEPDGASCGEAITAYLERWRPYLPARPEAVATVMAIRQSGRRIGLLSNTHWPRAIHEAALADDGLLDLLDGAVFTSELSHMKPHPEAFAAALGEVGVEPAHAVFVGDRLHDDIWGAQQAGMRAVWIRNTVMPFYDVEPDAVIDDLSALPGVVASFR